MSRFTWFYIERLFFEVIHTVVAAIFFLLIAGNDQCTEGNYTWYLKVNTGF